MTKKLTVEEINNRLLAKKIKIIGEYVSSNISTLLQCENGHQWKTRVANLIHRNDGCPVCSGHNHTKIWTTESINNHLKHRKITLITNYLGKVSTKGTFECENGHTWNTSINSVLSGKGCKYCYGKNLPLTLEEIQRRYRELGYVVSGEYVNYSSVLNFTCSHGHSWNATVGNTRCSSCAKYGFKSDRPSFGYILRFDSFIKYGISNSIKSRLHKHKIHNPPHSLILLLNFETGSEAKVWETGIKTDFGGHYATKNQCPDGYTETLPIEMLESVIEKYGDSWHRIS